VDEKQDFSRRYEIYGEAAADQVFLLSDTVLTYLENILFHSVQLSNDRPRHSVHFLEFDVKLH
jgi:hypothetical protein